MITPAQSSWPLAGRLPRGGLRACAFGFLYWLGFLLVLEPGNLLHASGAGQLPSLSHEVLRIAVAALLGAVASVVPALLTKNLPVAGAAWAKRAAIHAASAGALSFVLVVVSCFLAAWLLEGAWLPSPDEVRTQLTGNWLLLTYALGALTAVLHAFERQQGTAAAPAAVAPPAAPPLAAIAVKTRGQTEIVHLAEVDWIETQGNYLALHTRAGTHLVRDTLSAIEPRLDPARFLRIHRRIVVALNRIASLAPVGNGDAVARLADGQELRVSRSYREALKARWAPPAS